MIGPGQQAVQGVIALHGGGADAHRQMQAVAVVGIFVLLDVLTDFFGDFLRGLAVGVFQQNDEFFTAPAADDIGMAQATLQIAGEPDQYLIAGHVPVSIVQRLEVVEVKQQSGQRPGFALSLVQCLRGKNVEAASIRQFGEAVEGGMCLNLRLEAFDHPIEQRQH